MTPATMSAHMDIEYISRQLRNQKLLVKNLQNLCRAEGLSQVGTKPTLVNRLVEQARNYVQKADSRGFQRLSRMAADELSNRPPAVNRAPGGYSSSPAPAPPAPVPPPAPIVRPNYYAPPPMPGNSIMFKPNIFYNIKQQLGATKPCEMMAQHRHSVDIVIRKEDYRTIIDNLSNNGTTRVMVYCAGEPHGLQDIAFPHQSEIKVNGKEVKGNTRGLKNKPGTTRPVDITEHFTVVPAPYTFTVTMVYALTTKASGKQEKFFLMVKLVEAIPVKDLVQQLEAGAKITKESVVSEMVKKAQDTEIQAISSVLSLKCPLSTSRIKIPVRSTKCRHNACWDAATFVEMQLQGPTWTCPICQIPAPFNSLAIDGYVRDILKNTSSSVEQVNVEPNGDWSQPKTQSEDLTGDDVGSDEDLVEITNTKKIPAARNGVPSYVQTPASSREPSGSAPPAKSNGNGKRSAPIIDLTLSDDDEPIAPRPPKKQRPSNGGEAYGGQMLGYYN